MTIYDKLRGGLIVSVQARAGSALDDPGVLAAMAKAAEDNGAVGVRIQGVRNLEAVRRRVSIPMIGIIKREYEGFEPYITPTAREVRELLECGAEIVALDATARSRPHDTQLAELIQTIADAGAIAMADCATEGDAVAATAMGAPIVATTLCGYTKETAGTPLPALDLVRAMHSLDAFVICEGGIHAAHQGREAIDAGADAIVVGTAITNTEWLTKRFADALRL